MARAKAPGSKKKKPLVPTSIISIDSLATKSPCTLQDYIAAVSDYVKQNKNLDDGQKKSAQIRLSNGLAHALAEALKSRLPQMGNVKAAETPVSGALRIARADVSEMDALDGLRLAVEIKPINLAVGRAIWNRFGDIRTFAVNLHLKFPFSVIGGVLVIPTYEEKKTRKKGVETLELSSTIHLIQRAVKRLVRAGGRRTEGDAAHLLEGVGVIVYDPETATLDPTLPPDGSGLRWDEFINALVLAYDSRFVAEEVKAELAAATVAKELELELEIHGTDDADGDAEDEA